MRHALRPVDRIHDHQGILNYRVWVEVLVCLLGGIDFGVVTVDLVPSLDLALVVRDTSTSSSGAPFGEPLFEVRLGPSEDGVIM